jgi:hypothetical protein
MIRGFDVSFLTNWAALQAQHGISFGIARCMREPETKDAAFDANWQRMGDLDNFVRMAYAFASPALGTDAVEDARLMWQYVKAAGPLRPTDYFWLDLEKSVLTQEETNDWAERWFDEFTRISGNDGYSYWPGIYNGGYLMNRTGIGLDQRFGRLWYPRPETQYSDSWPTTFSPKLPIGASSWTDTNWGRKPDFWQSSFSFTFNGIDHDADLFDGTLDQLKELNMAITSTDVTKVWSQDATITPPVELTTPDNLTWAAKSALRELLKGKYLADQTLPHLATADELAAVKQAVEDLAADVKALRALLPGE